MNLKIDRNESIVLNLKYIKEYLNKINYIYVNIPPDEIGVVYKILHGKIELEYESDICNLYAGVYYEMNNNIVETERYYLKAIEKGNVPAMNNYGLMCLKKWDYVGAEKYYFMAIERGNVNAMNNYGVMCAIRGNYDEADRFYTMAIEKAYESGKEMEMYKMPLENILSNFYRREKNIDSLQLYIKLYKLTYDIIVLDEMKDFISKISGIVLYELIDSEQKLKEKVKEHAIYREYLKELGPLNTIIILIFSDSENFIFFFEVGSLF